MICARKLTVCHKELKCETGEKYFPTSWEILQTNLLENISYHFHILAQTLFASEFDSQHICISNLNLIYKSSCNTADDVANEEEAGDPGAEEEVDLDRVVDRRAVHHLGDRHAGEGEPTPNNGGPKRDAYCSQHLRPTSDMGLGLTNI